MSKSKPRIHLYKLNKEKLHAGVLCGMYSKHGTHDIQKVNCKMCLKKQKEKQNERHNIII